MNKAVLIIGLPGSGKTYLANTEYVPKGYTLIDDPSVSREEWFKLLKCLENKINVVITDPPLCNAEKRNHAIEFLEKRGYQSELVFFENNPDKCRKLLKLRNDDRIINSFDCFKYTIPNDVLPLKIFDRIKE